MENNISIEEITNKVNELEIRIKSQSKLNKIIYNITPTPNKEDPKGLKAIPYLKMWREGNKQINKLKQELANLSIILGKLQQAQHKEKFINSFGEATKRDILSLTYLRYNKKLSQDILNFIS